MGECTRIGFIDATKLSICHKSRITRYKVFEGVAVDDREPLTCYDFFKLV